jgi:hypothetical protein
MFSRSVWCISASATALLLGACGAPETAEPEGAPAELSDGVEASDQAVGKTAQPLRFENGCSEQQVGILTALFGYGVYPDVMDAVRALDRRSRPRLEAYFGPLITWQAIPIELQIRYLAQTLQTKELTYLCYGGQYGDCANPATMAVTTAASVATYICPNFWAQDTQAQLYILVHEAAHLAYTYDYNGPTGDPFQNAMYFAAYDPNTAYRNTDNYAMYIFNPWGVQ